MIGGPAGARLGTSRRPRIMLAFVARRLLATLPVLAMVAVFVFLMLRLTPGDPAAIIAGDNATGPQIEAIRDQLGLNRPIPVQFMIWLGKLLHGDLGGHLALLVPAHAVADHHEQRVLAVGVADAVLVAAAVADEAVLEDGEAHRRP